MKLHLRKVSTTRAHENYRVILKREDGEFEIGSIGSNPVARGVVQLAL